MAIKVLNTEKWVTTLAGSEEERTAVKNNNADDPESEEEGEGDTKMKGLSIAMI